MRVGAVFYNTSKDGTEQYMSPVLDKEVKELFPVLKKLKFSLTEVPEEKRTSDKSPYYYINMYMPDEKESF